MWETAWRAPFSNLLLFEVLGKLAQGDLSSQAPNSFIPMGIPVEYESPPLIRANTWLGVCLPVVGGRLGDGNRVVGGMVDGRPRHSGRGLHLEINFWRNYSVTHSESRAPFFKVAISVLVLKLRYTYDVNYTHVHWSWLYFARKISEV